MFLYLSFKTMQREELKNNSHIYNYVILGKYVNYFSFLLSDMLYGIDLHRLY